MSVPSDPERPGGARADVVAAPLGGAPLAPAGSELVLAQWTAGPGSGDAAQPSYQAPLHVHHHDDEAWYVLQGRLIVRVGDAEYEAPAGSAVIGPRGLPHTYWNPDPEPARYLLVMSASTIGLIRALHAGDRLTPARTRQLYAEHGCELLG